MCQRWLSLPYQAAIFAGDESFGPSKRRADPTTAKTTNTSPLRLDQTRKPRPAIQNPFLEVIETPALHSRRAQLHCVPMDFACPVVRMGRAGIEPATLGLKVPCSTN